MRLHALGVNLGEISSECWEALLQHKLELQTESYIANGLQIAEITAVLFGKLELKDAVEHWRQRFKHNTQPKADNRTAEFTDMLRRLAQKDRRG